ncbi:MAG: SidJ-related pseudokinase [Desulfosarcina sp.]|nr:SidJ-related pseudokinase [Desulfosarcina sp.]MBC2744031.1 SidJ-related pseudokinase [Desulfosarcina sp.]MBC2766940.1 SidJ-related pseudokinase [Desulfosarcina sp.]
MVHYPNTLKGQAEAALDDPRFDFIAKHHAVADLRRLARKHMGVLDGHTISALERLLQSNAFSRVRQAYFLFREAASVMTDMATAEDDGVLGSQALASLNSLLLKTDGSAHRGVAEAMGSLPVNITGPHLKNGGCPSPSAMSWTRLLSKNQLTLTGIPRYIGRSLVVETSQKNRMLVVKLAKKGDTAAGLEKEIRWMETLKKPDYAVGCRFHIPTPLYVKSHRVFRINRIPVAPPDTVNRHPDGLAIAFVAHRDYFVYPNHHRVDTVSAREMLGRNAFLLGRLASNGIIHDAPIPLFHNRTQRLRRDDQGRYQWFRSGRLDRWLDSCAFPNLGLSGLRDFEHLEPFRGGSRILYRHIGSHFLSLLLVAGSHFRCRDKAKVGLDDNGHPVDARDLFDRQVLKAMIVEVFESYFTGFTGTSASAALPVDLGRLTHCMIEEMGVDRHMTELLRRVDQQALTDSEFFAFLKERSYNASQLDDLKRGEKDILITSGPHLGDFNRQISLPELIACVAAMSAVCIAGRFLTEVKNAT